MWSLLRKAALALARGSSALGLRSPVLHGLSTAAGSRLLSTGGGGTTIYSKEEITRMRAEDDRNMEKIRQKLIAISENQRRRDENWANFKMKMERIETACDVTDLLCLSFFMGLIVHMHMQ